MLRGFTTHKIRRQTELTGLWHFTPLEGAQKGEQRLAAVPGCWETIPGLAQYRGGALYETGFEGGGNLRVVCKGVSHTASVRLDGKTIAEHYNAYTPFAGILANTKPGKHWLQIEVDNSFSEASALHIPNDYMTYGGIVRPVVVEELPDVYIEWVHATPMREKDGWTLELEALVTNIGPLPRAARLEAAIMGQSVAIPQCVLAAGEKHRFTARLALQDVEEYEPETPKLYMLETLLYLDGGNLPEDDLIERVGFRDVRVEGTKILFNGQPLRIKGFCRHEDHPHFGCALPLQAMEQDIQLMLDMGANAVRTSHYPNDELFLDLCDEHGLLVWEENHARGLTEEQMRNPNFDAQCEACIDEMVNAHYNHPSIVIWGVLNECASETEYGRKCYERQLQQIKAMDNSRPTSFSSCKCKTDICLDLPDIVSFNIYPEWYLEESAKSFLRDLYGWIQEETGGAGKPFLITETGAGAIFGNRGTNESKWSEERQAEILQHQLEAVFGLAECSGVFIWQFCDVRVSEEWFMNRPRTMNNKGVVDEYRRRKLAYPVVRSALQSRGNYFGEEDG